MTDKFQEALREYGRLCRVDGWEEGLGGGDIRADSRHADIAVAEAAVRAIYEADRADSKLHFYATQPDGEKKEMLTVECDNWSSGKTPEAELRVVGESRTGHG